MPLARPRPRWRLPARLPTIPLETASYRLILDARSRIHRFHPTHQSCMVNIKPIVMLTQPIAPLAKGPNILRAFLWAREKYPDRNFGEVKDEAMEAVYSSHRVDGLPRIAWTLGKDVRQIVNGRVKVGGVLRHKVKRRARAAFREAVEGALKEDPHRRWDMDALFFLKSNTLRLPYPQLVQDMREIINIGFAHRDFVKVGRANAVASKRFLPPYPSTIDPPHVLTLLAEKLGVESISQASKEDDLNRSGRSEIELWEEEGELPEELDLQEVAKEMVLGVQAEAEVLDDGTVQVIPGSEIVPAGHLLATDKTKKADRKVRKASEKPESRFEVRKKFTKQRTQSEISGRKMRRDPLESRTQATEDRPVRADTPLPNHTDLEARVMVHDASVHPEYSTVQPRGMANDQRSHSKAREMYNDENDVHKLGGFKARVMRETEMDEPVSQVRSMEEYAYESTSFDWLLDPAPPQRQLARSPSRSEEAPKFQWTPLEREQVEADEGVVGQEDVESLEEELEGLYPGQGEEDDWGLNDDDPDPGKRDREPRR